MKLSNPMLKTNLNNRLKRIEGQLRGVQGMIAEERDCREVMQQISAIRAALQSASLEIVEEYAGDCLLNLQASASDRQQTLTDLMYMFGKIS